jgi:hypothetical protein
MTVSSLLAGCLHNYDSEDRSRRPPWYWVGNWFLPSRGSSPAARPSSCRPTPILAVDLPVFVLRLDAWIGGRRPAHSVEGAGVTRRNRGLETPLLSRLFFSALANRSSCRFTHFVLVASLVPDCAGPQAGRPSSLPDAWPDRLRVEKPHLSVHLEVRPRRQPPAR